MSNSGYNNNHKRLDMINPEQKKAIKSKKTKPKKQIPRLLILVIVVVVISGIYEVLHVIGLDLIKAPHQVSDKLVTDIQQNNLSAVYSLSVPGASSQTSTSAARKILLVDSAFLKGKASLISGLKFTGGKAVMIYQIKNSNGKVAFLKVLLEQYPLNSGVWKVASFQAWSTKPELNLNPTD